jgi:hypothetical protein
LRIDFFASLRAKIEPCLPQAGKILEARPSERLDFFAALRLCEQKEERDKKPVCRQAGKSREARD